MKLAADQVCKAVSSHGNIMNNRLYEDWQAVADELNASLGGGECEMKPIEWHGLPRVNYICSVCDVSVYDAHPNYCPNCGRKVKR